MTRGQHVDPRRRAGANQQRAALQALKLPDDLAGIGQRREHPLGALLD